MDKKLSEKLSQVKQAAQLLKTLSNEQRLFILCALGIKDMNVSELVKVVEIPQTTVSQHLSRLRLEGYVQAQRDGKNVIYSLNSPLIKEIINLLQNEYCP